MSSKIKYVLTLTVALAVGIGFALGGMQIGQWWFDTSEYNCYSTVSSNSQHPLAIEGMKDNKMTGKECNLLLDSLLGGTKAEREAVDKFKAIQATQ